MTDPRDTALLRLAAEIDVIDLAGQIIANPRATRVSLAGELALACGVERFWAVCLETELLIRALDMPIVGTSENAATRHHAIFTQIATVRRLMAELRGETNTANQETNSGTGD